MADDRRAFVTRAIAAARISAPSHIPALGPVTVAQAILESGYGRSGLALKHSNYFGIKARGNEARVMLDTTEFVGGVATRLPQGFKVYQDMTASFRDHAQLFARLPITYKKALAHPLDPVMFARGLVGVYATDPRYADKLEALFREWALLEAFGFKRAAGSGAAVAAPRGGAAPGREGGTQAGTAAAVVVVGFVAVLLWAAAR